MKQIMNIYPTDMQQIEIFANKKNREKITDELYDLGLLHLKKYKNEIEFIDLAKPLENTEQTTAMYLKLNSAINLVLKKKKNTKDYKTVDVDANSFFPSVELQINAIKQIDEIDEQIIDVELVIKEAQELKKINAKNIGVFDGLSNHNVAYIESNDAPKIADQLNKLKNAIYYASSKSGNIIIVFPKNEQKQFNEIIAKFNAKQKDINSVFELFREANTVKTDKIIEYFANKKNQLMNLKVKLKENGLIFFQKNKDKIFSLNQILKNKVYKKEGALFFGETSSTIYISGWIPTLKLNILQSKIAKFKGIYINAKKAGDDAPVFLKHKKPAENYSMLLDFYALPKSNTIDPSAFMAITFPFIFGLIVGDMGYGLIIFILSLFLAKINQAKQLSFILKTSGISCIVFGYIFGEFFGAESIFGLFHLHSYLNRVHELNTLMLVCMGVGLLHVNFGFVLSAIKHLNHKNYLHFAGALSWILLQISIALIYFKQTYIGIFLAILSIGIIYKAESIMGLIEIPSLFGNILSYMRIMAVGLASVYLAMIVNEQALGLMNSGTIGLIAGVFVLVLGHGFNTLLAMLSPFIHTMRLHYVEFFMKFYESGGEKYRPFGKVYNKNV